jgi:hypothetical protein
MFVVGEGMEKHHSESQRQPPSGCIAQLKFKQLKCFTPKKGRPDAGGTPTIQIIQKKNL